MTKREFFDLSFRVISVFLFLDLLSRTPGYLAYYVDGGWSENPVQKVTNIVLFFGVPLTIIWMSRTRSEWFLEKVLGKNMSNDAITPTSDDQDTSEEEPETPENRGFTAENVQQIAFVILGLWIVASALPEFIRDLVVYLDREPSEIEALRDTFVGPSANWPRMVVTGVKSVIGLGLIVYGDNLSGAIKRMRLAGSEM